MRWIAVRHGDDHIHIVAMLARQDGRRWRLDFEKKRVREACLAAEERYGLESTAPGDSTAARRPSRAETEKAARRGLDEAPRVTLRRQVFTAAAGARSDSEFFARLEAAGVLVRQRFSAKNPGQVTGYAVALPGDTGKDGGPVWFGGGKLAADLSWPKLRCRWAGPGTAPGDPFTAAERNAIWDHAARAADQAAAQIRALAGTDPAAAADAAWAASDTLHAAAAALRSRPLRQAADAYDRAARAPYARVPAPTPAGNSLRRAARLISAYAYLAKDPSLAPVVLILRLAALAEAVAELRQAQQRAAQAAGALRAASSCTPPPRPPAQARRAAPGAEPGGAGGRVVPVPAPPRPGRPRCPGRAQARPRRSRAVPPPRQVTPGPEPVTTRRRTTMTIDPSARHASPFGEAYGSASQQAAQLVSMAVAAHEIITRRKARRAAMKAARDEQQRQALREQEGAAREAARARWAPALDPRWLAQADLLTAGRAWGAAAPYADNPEAASALRRAEERLRVLHPYAMDHYDRLRYEGASPLEAMREAVPLFALEPHARPGQPAPRAGGHGRRAGAGPGPPPGREAPRGGFRQDADQAAYRHGQRIAEQLQARALAERGARLSPDELFTELEVKTTLPPEVITRLARTRGEENTAARAARARAAGQNLAAAVSAGQPAGGPAEAPGSAAAGAPPPPPVPQPCGRAGSPGPDRGPARGRELPQHGRRGHPGRPQRAAAAARRVAVPHGRHGENLAPPALPVR